MTDYAGSEVTHDPMYNSAPSYQTDFGPSDGSVCVLVDYITNAEVIRTVPLLVRSGLFIND